MCGSAVRGSCRPGNGRPLPLHWNEARRDREKDAAEASVIIRCTLDGLMLDADWLERAQVLRAYDGAEPFLMDALEARFYQLVSATPQEMLILERSRYRLLRRAADFQAVPE